MLDNSRFGRLIASIVCMKLVQRGLAAAGLGWALWFWGGNEAFAAVSVTIGQNFLGSTYGVDTAALPPDSNGAIGPAHFVEFINGSFAVYTKTNGHQVKRIADTKFWSNAGVILSTSDTVTDPRVIYDAVSQRWFASMVDADANAPSGDPTLEANDFLLAVSATSDPTGIWHGFLLQADPDNGYFADFPTLGVDGNAVYLSGDMFQGQTSPLGASLVSFPKSDLLLSTPTITNRTWYGVMDYSLHGEVLQPVICTDGSVTGRILSISDIGLDSNPHSNLLCSVVMNAGTTNGALMPAAIIQTAPWVVPDNPDFPDGPLLTVTQPDGTSTVMANDARVSAKVYAVNGVLYAVHNTELNGHVAIQWYRVRASDNALLEAGTLSDPSLDLFFPSIAANSFGVVVIAYDATGPSTTISSFATVGQTANGATTFGTPILLQAGATSYHGDDEVLADLLGEPVFSRWGDYSATSVDPADPNNFWTIQMFPSDGANNDVWSTQITQLITVPPAPTLTVAAGGGNNLTLSWPLGPNTYQVQYTTNIAAPVTWLTNNQAQVTNGSQVSVTLPTSILGREFFRLKQL